jgi:hypothetical protein
MLYWAFLGLATLVNVFAIKSLPWVRNFYIRTTCVTNADSVYLRLGVARDIHTSCSTLARIGRCYLRCIAHQKYR